MLASQLAVAAEPSGAAWVKKFPSSRDVADLAKGFRENVVTFEKAAEDAGATVKVLATVRPKERAYLMHWAWVIVNERSNAKTIPPMEGIDIDWWHGTQAASEAKAKEMIDAYGIGNLKVAPALKSRHIDGKAIDMAVTWTGTLKIKDKDGK